MPDPDLEYAEEVVATMQVLEDVIDAALAPIAFYLNGNAEMIACHIATTLMIDARLKIERSAPDAR